jgi:hypothetical protein
LISPEDFSEVSKPLSEHFFGHVAKICQIDQKHKLHFLNFPQFCLHTPVPAEGMTVPPYGSKTRGLYVYAASRPSQEAPRVKPI